MSEIGSGSGTSYPTALDTDNTLEYNVSSASKTRARAEVVNDLADAIIAIETELGTAPSGTAATVKDFLQVQHNTDGSHKSITTNTLTATGQITSSLAIGTKPLVITSTTKCDNLNADLLDDMNSATANTASTIVARDASGNFAAGTITASLTGTATTATRLTDGTNTIRTKIVNMGAWNMDTTVELTVAHGLSLSKIRDVSATIIDDALTFLISIFNYGGSVSGTTWADTTNVGAQRVTGGAFDNTGFDNTGISRGFFVITYVD